MNFLLDTNSMVRLLNGDRAMNAQIRRRRRAWVGVSSVVAFELFFGAFKSGRVKENLHRVDALGFEIVPFEWQDAREAGELRAALEQAGTPIGGYDGLIAGQARARNLTLVTHNTREFSRVPGLRIEDWQL